MQFIAADDGVVNNRRSVGDGILSLIERLGDDAAGRGMARGFAVILGPILLVAAALFIWGQRGGPRPAFWAGFRIMAIPLVFFLVMILASQCFVTELTRVTG